MGDPQQSNSTSQNILHILKGIDGKQDKFDKKMDQTREDIGDIKGDIKRHGESIDNLKTSDAAQWRKLETIDAAPAPAPAPLPMNPGNPGPQEKTQVAQFGPFKFSGFSAKAIGKIFVNLGRLIGFIVLMWLLLKSHGIDPTVLFTE